VAQVSAVDDVIAALLTTIGAYESEGIRYLDAALTKPVCDGVPVTATAASGFVLIGDDGAPEVTGEPAASVTQDWGTFEAGSRTEEGTVTCAVVSQSGDDDLAVHRAATKADMVTVEARLRATDNLGGVVAAGGIDTISLHQGRNANGGFVRRVFTYRYTAYQG